MAMKNPPHPGLSVRHDCLEPLGLSLTDGARVLGVSRKQFSDVVNCHSGISPEMAIRLDKAFGGGAETWYRLQAAYDLAQAMRHESRITTDGMHSPQPTSPRRAMRLAEQPESALPKSSTETTLQAEM